jgi:hypothetical protein
MAVWPALVPLSLDVPHYDMDGNFTLPAPYHYRYSSNNWKLFALVGESIAAINVSILMNGLLQPILIRFASDSLVWRLVNATLD